MLEAFHDAKLDLVVRRRIVPAADFHFDWQDPEKSPPADASRTTIDNLNARIRAWWKMSAIFAAAVVIGRVGSLILFGIISFLAMREYMTLVPTRRGDHRTLFWSFFVIMPLQYYLVGIQWYILFAIMIPVLACIFIPPSIAIAGDTEHFLERASKIQFGIMVCVYSLSHAPALLLLKIPEFEGHDARLLLYLVIVDQMSDVLQYVWGKLIGKHKIAWRVSPNKTWEGFAGGVVSATASARRSGGPLRLPRCNQRECLS